METCFLSDGVSILPRYTKGLISTIRNFPLSTLEHVFRRIGAECTMPVHVIWGTRDAVVPFSNQPRMCALIPRATSLVIENCGHTEMFAKFYSDFRGSLLTFLYQPTEVPV